MFVDASAWTAILLAEAESEVFMAKLADAAIAKATGGAL